MSHQKDGFSTRGMAEIANDPETVEEIIGWYIDVFNATGPDEWNESWTPDQVSAKLFADTVGDRDRSFVSTWHKGGVLAGLGIIVVAPVDRFNVGDLPPGCQDEATLDAVKRHLAWIAGPGAPIVFYREFGIRKEHRGGLAPILRVLGDSLEAGAGHGAQYACCWTSRRKRLHPILVGLDLHLAYAFRDDADNVLVGDHFPHLLRKIRTPAPEAAAIIGERLRQHAHCP